MDIWKSGSRPTAPAPANYFTGNVWMDKIIEAPAPASLHALVVTFSPHARTYWHTHPLGQTLQVLSGVGLVQKWGEKVCEIRPGDVVWIAPGEKHWHGACPETAMVHLAMQESEDGVGVVWLEEVSEEQYNGPRAD